MVLEQNWEFLIHIGRLHSALTCRYRKYTATLKSKKGGAGRDAYRSLMWDVPITTADLCDDENIQLQKEVAILKHQIEDLEKAAMFTPNANKRKPLSECSQSQIRKRKKVVLTRKTFPCSFHGCQKKSVWFLCHFKPSICIQTREKKFRWKISNYLVEHS